jgi:hypothetical protein
MVKIIKNISPYILLSILIVWVGVDLIKSEFLTSILGKDLVTFLLAILAIHITFISLLLPKIQELAEKKGVKFSGTIKEVKLSVKEQLVLLAIASVSLIFSESASLVSVFEKYEILVFVFQTIQIFSLLYSFRVLYDAFNALVLLILELSNS